MTLDDYPLTFRRVEKPSEDVCHPLRRVIVGVMLAERQTLHVNHILRLTKNRLREKDDADEWLFPVALRKVGNLNIRRRTNECTYPHLWADGPPPLVHVGEDKSPWYALNPDRFPEVANEQKPR